MRGGTFAPKYWWYLLCLIVHSVNVGGTYDEPAAILTIWIEVVTGPVSPWLQEASHVEGTT